MFEKEKFDKAVAEYERPDNPYGIGIINEGMLHSVIKKSIAQSDDQTEVKIDGKNIADVKIGNTVYEIQTENLFPVKKKLDFYLEKTELDVNIVFPVAREKYICWADPLSGEVTPPHKSPKKRSLVDYADTLIFLTDYIGNPRVTLTVMYISECEYRNLDGKRSKDKKRGSTRIERRPTELLFVEHLKTRDDYEFLLPQAESFTRKEYAKEKKLTSQRKLSYSIKMMLSLGLVRDDGKIKNEKVYKTIPRDERN